jgi:hypothetical protein
LFEKVPWLQRIDSLTRSIDDLPGECIWLRYLRLGCNESNKLELGVLGATAGFFQGTVFVIGVSFRVNGEHFSFRDQVEGFTDAKDRDYARERTLLAGKQTQRVVMQVRWR